LGKLDEYQDEAANTRDSPVVCKGCAIVYEDTGPVSTTGWFSPGFWVPVG
jgi:hypothetical protein